MTPPAEPRYADPPYADPPYAWMNGGIVAWDDCLLHGRSQGAFWGANVFEGVRGYWSPGTDQLRLFRLDDHLRRLRQSMRALRLAHRITDSELVDACCQLCRANEFREDIHLVIVAYFGRGTGWDTLGVTDDTGIHITALPRPRAPGYAGGLSVGIASWRRISDDTIPPRIKSGANYANSRLAHQEAVRHGYDTALILNRGGTVAESPGACVVMVREGAVVTSPATSGALEGITVATAAELARRHLGLTLTRREIDRTELYAADELFLCGTLAEIAPVTAVDGIPVGSGSPGPVTRKLQALYEHAVRHGAGYEGWLTPVLTPVPAAGADPAAEPAAVQPAGVRSAAGTPAGVQPAAVGR
ncbi:MAG TPA: aminotransferase class IV [Acidimicrobiia bacterium]|nr:aminotransferase class IV [Acidimicrobiia bacterium]